jgi:hypothetical protein
MNDLIKKWQTDLQDAWWEIQCPTPLYPMRHFVVGQHDTLGQQWAQCMLELKNRIQNLRRAAIGRRRLIRRISNLEAKQSEPARDRADELRIDLEELQYAEGGTIREVGHLLTIMAELEARHDGKGWTREELDAEQPMYWNLRAQRQAIQDLNAHGNVMVGNQDMLRMMGKPIDPPERHVSSVERRFLERGNIRVLVAVPTLMTREEIQGRNALQCLNGWSIPSSIERKVLVIDGRPIADAYNEAARIALDDNADFMLCVEDDHIIPAGTFERLWAAYEKYGRKAIVGAWYPQKTDPRTGAPIVLRDGRRVYLVDDGDVHDVYTVPQGYTLIPTQAFREIPQPWFASTSCLTQDSFFSQQAREAGWRLVVDTSARIKHVCRETGRVYE